MADLVVRVRTKLVAALVSVTVEEELLANRFVHAGPLLASATLRAVPSIRISGPYEIYFTSHDRGEPAHVHVDRENMAAKVWLAPISVAYNLGYARHELRNIERLISDNRELCLRKWNEYFGT